MNTVRRQKVLVTPFLEVRDADGNLVREIQCPQAILYYPHCKQLEDLLHKLEVDAMDAENRAGRAAKMSNGAKVVSRERANAKELHEGTPERSAGAGEGAGAP